MHPDFEKLAEALPVAQGAHHSRGCRRRTAGVAGRRAPRKCCEPAPWPRARRAGPDWGRVCRRGRESKAQSPSAPHLRVALATHRWLDQRCARVCPSPRADSPRPGWGQFPPPGRWSPLRWFLPPGGPCPARWPALGVGPHVDPSPPAEHPRAILCQRRVDFRHDAVGRPGARGNGPRRDRRACKEGRCRPRKRSTRRTAPPRPARRR